MLAALIPHEVVSFQKKTVFGMTPNLSLSWLATMRNTLSNSLHYPLSILLFLTLWICSPAAVVAETPPKLLAGDSVGLALFDRKVSLQLDAGATKGSEKLALIVESGKFARLNVFELQNPRRMVIDLYGKTPPRVREYTTPESNALSRVRIGTHLDRLRIVADLRDEFANAAEWHIVSNVLEIEFPQSAPAKVDASDTFGLISNEQPEILEVRSIVESGKEQPADLIVEEPKDVVRRDGLTPTILTAQRIMNTAVQTTVVPDNALVAFTPDSNTLELPELQRAVIDAHDVETTLLAREEIGTTPQREPAAELTEAIVKNHEEALAEDRQPVTTSTEIASIDEQDVRASIQLPTDAQENLHDESSPIKLAPEPEVGAVQALTSIQFDYHQEDRAPLVKFKLTEHPQFTLVRKSQELFSINIPDCTLQGTGLDLPFFPPHDFQGFLMIKAEPKGSGIRIEVNVDKGTQLVSYVRQNNIFLRATNASKKPS
jgi:hypothetical protein